MRDTPHFRVFTSSVGERFFDISMPVSENSAFSEEAFAEQVLDNVTPPRVTQWALCKSV